MFARLFSTRKKKSKNKNKKNSTGAESNTSVTSQQSKREYMENRVSPKQTIYDRTKLLPKTRALQILKINTVVLDSFSAQLQVTMPFQYFNEIMEHIDVIYCFY
jgi:hypothetical protein